MFTDFNITNKMTVIMLIKRIDMPQRSDPVTHHPLTGIIHPITTIQAGFKILSGLNEIPSVFQK